MRVATAPGGGSFLANALLPLRAYPDFRALWCSTLFASSAWWGLNVVLAWLAFDLTDSEFAVAAAASVGFAPMLLGPVGGLLADRVHRPRLLIGAQLVALASGTAIGLLATFDLAEYWHLLVAGLLIGSTMAPLQPTRFTLTMDLVGARHVSSANAVNAVGMLGSRVVVPAAAGVVIAALGAGPALLFCAAWFVPASWVLLRLEDRRPARAQHPPALRGIAEGFRYALASPPIRAVILVTIAANLLGWPVVLSFLPVFAEEVFDVGAGGLGVIVGVNGFGALLGALGIAAMGDLRRKGALFLGATGLFGLGLAAFAVSDVFALALVLILIAGAGSAGFGVMQSTLPMLLSPEEVRGRVLGVLMLSISVLPAALLLQGAIASAAGVEATTAVAGALLAVAMGAVALAVPELRRAG